MSSTLRKLGATVQKKVYLGFDIKVVAFDEALQHLTVCCLLYTEYPDEEYLAVNKNALDLNQFCAGYGGFIPTYMVHNSVGSHMEGPLIETYVNYYTRKVMTTLSNTHTVKCPMDLRRFPFDMQILMVNIVGLNCVFRKYKIKGDVFTRLLLRNECLRKYTVTTLPSHFVVQNLHVVYNSRGPEILITVTRRVKYYFFNYCLIIYLIVGANASIIAIPPDQATDRISVTITLLLTLVAFKFVINDGIDKANYLTLMDMYIIIGFGCIILCLMENVIVCFLYEQWHDSVIRADYIMQGTILLLWSVFHVVLYGFCSRPDFLRPTWQNVYAYILSLGQNVVDEAMAVVGYKEQSIQLKDKRIRLINPHL